MIYPKDNRFTLSNNIHSLGLQNNMTTTPTWGSVSYLNELANNKRYLGAGAIRAQSLVPGMPSVSGNR
jgi:hypothetical protein